MKIGSSHKVIPIALVLSILLFPFLASAAPARAQAQAETVIESLRIDIWPEYDKPSVLVIYHITLSSQTKLPANMTFRLPAAVGQPSAVAMQDPNGLFNVNFTTTPAGEWEEIKFQTPVPDVRIEYYDPSLVKNGNTRKFSFRWPGDYTVNNLSLTVQHPAGATNLALKPDMGSGRSGDDGLTYYSYLVGKVNAGTNFEVALSYDKASDQLTSASQFQQVQPSKAISTNTAGRITLGQVLPWALGGLGVLLIAAGLTWYWRTGRAPQASGRKRHARSAPAASEEKSLTSGFCHQCGKKAAPGDVFCRACGTRLR